MSYEDEHDKALTVAVAITEAVDQLRELHEEYPHLVALVFHILYGQMVHSSLECPACGVEMKFKSNYPVGGLINTLEEIETVYELLNAEIEFGGE